MPFYEAVLTFMGMQAVVKNPDFLYMIGGRTAVARAKLDDGKMVRFLDINHVFLGQDGLIPWTIMPDQLHPTAAGYQLWAEAIQPMLTAMMK